MQSRANRFPLGGGRRGPSPWWQSDARARVQTHVTARGAQGRFQLIDQRDEPRPEAYHASPEFSHTCIGDARACGCPGATASRRPDSRGGAETVLGAFLDAAQVSELGEGMREPRHRGFGQAAARCSVLDCRACDRRGESRPAPRDRAPARSRNDGPWAAAWPAALCESDSLTSSDLSRIILH